jgi:flavodoxin
LTLQIDCLKLQTRKHSSSQPVECQSAFQVNNDWKSTHTNVIQPLKKLFNPKAYTIVDEFGCAGFNTNKFLKYFGGINKGRPNEEDLKHAEVFAEKLKA